MCQVKKQRKNIRYSITMFASGAKVPQVWMPYTLDFNRPQLIQVRTIPRLGLLPVLIVEQEVAW